MRALLGTASHFFLIAPLVTEREGWKLVTREGGVEDRNLCEFGGVGVEQVCVCLVLLHPLCLHLSHLFWGFIVV